MPASGRGWRCSSIPKLRSTSPFPQGSWAEAEVGASPHPEEREDALPSKAGFLESKDRGELLGKVESHLFPLVIQNHPDPPGIPTRGEGGWGGGESSVPIPAAPHSPDPLLRPKLQAAPPGQGISGHTEGPGPTSHHLHLPAMPPRGETPVAQHAAEDIKSPGVGGQILLCIRPPHPPAVPGHDEARVGSVRVQSDKCCLGWRKWVAEEGVTPPQLFFSPSTTNLPLLGA